MALRKYWTREAGGLGTPTPLNLLGDPQYLTRAYAGNSDDTVLDCLLEFSFAINTPDTSTSPPVAWWNAQGVYACAYAYDSTAGDPLLDPHDDDERIICTGAAMMQSPVRYTSLASGSTPSWTTVWTTTYPLRSKGMRKPAAPGNLPAVKASINIYSDFGALALHTSQYSFWYTSYIRVLWGTTH